MNVNIPLNLVLSLFLSGLAIVLLTPMVSVAQDYQMEWISLEDGLSQSSVSQFAQDQKGFLWIGTMDGLNCYDGHQIKVYNNEPFNKGSLASNVIGALKVDLHGRLWVGTIGGGLHLFDPASESFFRIRYNAEDSTSISSDFITSIHQDHAGHIWVGTVNGLNRLFIHAGKEQFHATFERYLYMENPGRNDRNSTNVIKSLGSDSQNNLWVGTESGLIRFSVDLSGKLEYRNSYSQDKDDPESLSGKGVSTLLNDKDNRLWVGTYSGLNLLDKKSGKFNRFYPAGTMEGSPANEILSLEQHQDGRIMVTTYHGLSFMNVKTGLTGKIEPEFTFLEHPELDIPTTTTTLEDRLNPQVFWVGTSEAGVLKVNRRPKRFFSNDLSHAHKKGLVSSSIFGINKTADGQIWMAGHNGLLQYDRSKDEFYLHRQNSEEKEGLKAFAAVSCFTDSKGQLWVGTYNGLHKLLSHSGGKAKFRHYYSGEKQSDHSALSIYENKNGQILFGTFTGLNIYDPKTDQVLDKPIVLDTNAFHRRGYRITCMMEDGRGNYWIGSSKGLILAEGIENPVEDFESSKCRFFYHEEGDKSSIRNDYIASLYEDQKGRIWAGTFNGLIRVDHHVDKVSFRSYTEEDGLCNNVVYAILGDDNGKLWLSTNKGLSRFDPDLESFDNFSVEDGLQGSEFNMWAYSRAADGEMFFGGVKGFTSFYPDQIKANETVPPVWIKSLKTINGKTLSVLNNPEKEIRLRYNQNSFTLDFIALDYAFPEKVKYAYSIDQEGDNWVELGKASQVNFSRLSPGHYNLKVKASNHDGVWNPQPASLLLFIQPPFWRTAWFLSLVFLFVAFGAYYLHRLKWQLKLRELKEIERFRKATAEDFHDELGSKLTIISLFSEITKEKLNGEASAVGPYLDKVIDTSNSLYHSMKDLIWALNPEQDTVYDLAIQIKDFGDELFDQTDVVFRTEGLDQSVMSQELPMEYKRHILLVFKEAMNNVLKHSQCNSVCLRVSNGEGKLKISLEDDGKGFDSSLIDAGEGIHNMNSRAERITGNLKILSDKGKGTTVLLEFPIGMNKN